MNRFRSIAPVLAAALLSACGGKKNGGGSNCTGGTVLCNGTCVDFQTDASNCGACGAPCPVPQSCIAAQCVLGCASGTRCGQVGAPGAADVGAQYCADTQASALDCGGCGLACPAGQVCAAGYCQRPACDPGLVLCSGACANLLSDAANCGACGIACAGGQTCAAGACTSAACGGALGLPGAPAALAGENPVALVAALLGSPPFSALVTANDVAAGTVTVLRADGHGSFGDPVAWAVDANPSTLAAGSVNPGDDAVTDLVVGSRSASVTSAHVLLGATNGGFADAIPGAGGDAGPAPQAVALVDVDGDGVVDLVVGNAMGGGISGKNLHVFLNDGHGLFGTGTGSAPRPANAEYTVGSNVVAIVPVTASTLNGDSAPDLVVVTDDRADVLLGTLDPGAPFQAPIHYDVLNGVGTHLRPTAAAVSDLDGLYGPDLLVSVPSGGGVAVFLNQGMASSQWLGLVRSGPIFQTGPAAAIAAADLDGDGIPDILAADSSAGDVTALHGRGSVAGGVGFDQALSYPAGIAPSALALLEVDSDGLVDVAVAGAGSGTAAVLRNASVTGSVRLIAPAALPAGSAPLAAVLANLSGSAALDVAVADAAEDAVRVRLGAGDGTFSTEYLLQEALGSAPAALSALDLDGDGTVDLAVAFQGTGEIAMYWGDVTAAPARTSVATLGSPQVILALPGGLIVAATGDNAIAAIPRAPGRSFGAPALYTVGAGPVAIAAGDLNGDGCPDLAAAGALDGTLAILVCDPAIDFAWRKAVVYGAAPSPSGVAIADFDGDGKLDVAVASLGGGEVVILRNLGNGAGGQPLLGAPAAFPAGVRPRSVVAADVDGDGIMDLVLGAEGSGAAVVLRGLGGGAFGRPALFETGGAATGVAVGDLNGDGRLDVIAASSAPAQQLGGAALTVHLGACLP